ncbi:hypothetical protein SCHPADRAFT_620305 [Schizopora paradoxa]|uniref:Heterokaryon incompatibility domain-containing protein n=1 Tax=Schizopora paradoxa TaxID=27342 RepID=A0A0H2R9R5_9AGAM|nr:hypothetical protein SCHPADRAFT_620305 [Schizopora paradoxa]
MPDHTYRLEEDLVVGVTYIEEQGDFEANNRQNSVARIDDSTVRDAITEPSNIRPRRLWDLYANRVVPYHYHYSSRRRDGSNKPIRYPFCAISHSWTDDMVIADTPVNGHNWPVPFPAGVSLEAVRNEMLNLGEEYVWLDVLCLRQMSTDIASEKLRKEEWVVDLPTIGILYDHYSRQVVWYMNGLGRAFEAKGWDNVRHWLNRAWTLQEAKAGSVFGGIPEGIQDPRKVKSSDTNELFEHRLAAVDLCRKERTRETQGICSHLSSLLCDAGARQTPLTRSLVSP